MSYENWTPCDCGPGVCNGGAGYIPDVETGQCWKEKPVVRTDGAAVTCPTCEANFGGMVYCPWDGAKLEPLADADPTAVAFYKLVASR